MRAQALFINGIYRSVLEEILRTHSVNPERTLYLQPYDGRPIVMLRDNPPTVEDPVRLYASTTDELSQVSYSADIVGWEDKTKLSRSRTRELNKMRGVHNAFSIAEMRNIGTSTWFLSMKLPS